MPTFSTTFTPPAAPSGFELEGDLAASAVRMTWDASAIPQVDFAGFRVYRSLDNGVTWTLLTTLALVSETSYDDYAAPLNVPLVYQLTQSNLDFESEAVEGSISLDDSRWHVVVPGDLGLTFAIPKLRSARLTSSKVADTFAPMGRPTKIVVGDVVQAEDGEITFLALPDNLGMVALARAVQRRMDGGILLKASDGSVWEVAFGSMTRSFTNYGGQEISIPFTGTG